MDGASNFLWGRRSLRNDIFIKPPKFDKKKESAHTYASFGGNGTTVSVSSYGHIMQMSCYLSFGCSGFVCVDSRYIRPWYVQSRTEEILESSKDPKRGLRLDIMDWSGIQNLSLGFMYDRWPRYVINRATPSKPDGASAVPTVENSALPTNEPPTPILKPEKSPVEDIPVSTKKPSAPIPGCSLSIQYYSFENTVIQKYQILLGESGISPEKINWGNLSLIPEVSIRSLNFVDDLAFDEEGVVSESRLLSDSSIMLVRAIPKGHFLEEESKQHPKEEDSTGPTDQKTKDEPNVNMLDRPVAVALVISPFINDRPANIVDGAYINLGRVEGEERLVVTVAYTVKLLYSDCREIFDISEPAVVTDDHRATSIIDAETTERSVPEPVTNVDNDGEAASVIDTGTTQKCSESDVANVSSTVTSSAQPKICETKHETSTAGEESDDHEATSVVDAQTAQRLVSESDVDNMLEPGTNSAQSDAHETSTDVEKSGSTIRKSALAEEWASEVKRAMQEMSKVFCEESMFRRICFSPNKDLDYAFRRNLEHILSVCSIPIPVEQNRVTPSLRGPAVAITCGDIAGHRIGPRASLAAIQFLCLLLQYLDPKSEHELRYRRILTEADQDKTASASRKPKDPDDTEAPGISGLTKAEEAEQRRVADRYISQLHKRILRVLKGHVVWVCVKAECAPLESFYPHHWPDGRRIFNLEWLPFQSLVDTPLQLLKILCYEKIPKSSQEHIWKRQDYTWEQKWIQKRLRPKARSWIDKLHKINERGTYAFYDHTTPPKYYWLEGENPKYRLTDHVMIGLALKLVEQLKLKTKYHVWPYYSYEEVRNKVSKRFTTENPISKQRMLATSRWKDETRFLLHTKDAFLFSAEGLDFLQDRARALISSKREQTGSEYAASIDPWRYADRRWAKLLDAQAYHDDFQLLEWDNPLWYALVLILACKGTRVNNETCDKVIESSRSVLLGTTSYNGLFAGRLGRKNAPESFESEYDRDDYWFRTFETAHIMWTSCTTDESNTAQSKPIPPPSTSVLVPGPLLASKETTRTGQQVEKHVPFTNIGPSKTQTGIVVLSDDWLQVPPAFLDFSSKSQMVDTTFSTEDRRRSNIRSDRDVTIKFGRAPKRLPSDMVGVVIDVPKWSLGTEISRSQLASHNVTTQLTRQTIWESKKRIVWLPYCDESVAGKCLDVSSSVEKESLLSFLRRNREGEQYFLDSATAELNEWETELHLSFFGISHKREGSLHELESRSFLTSYTMSLRFSGDFSDRYWICYFLEPQTDRTSGKTLGERLPPNKDCGIRGDLGLSIAHTEVVGPSERLKFRNAKRTAGLWQQGSWQQRKVLELLIYSKMLQELKENTNSIFRAVKRLALRSHNDKHPNHITNPFRTAIDEANRLQQLGEKEDYASIAKEWRRYIQILIVVEENLVDNIEKISQWERREDDRQSQQPRWTDRDRRNHFTTILRLTILTERQAGDIKRLKDDVRTFRESLPSQLESIREDISFRGSQNINLFTYVTIVFLPLGFATGALSMNGPPDHNLLMNLVYLSLVAFGLTLFALLNAKSVKLILPLFLRFPQRFVKHLIFHRFAAPIIYHFAQREKQKEQEQHQEVREKVLESALVASVSALPAVAALRSRSIIADLDRTAQDQHLKEQDSTMIHSDGREGWREKYQDILHFSFLTAVRKEDRKQSKAPIQKRKIRSKEHERFSFKNLVHRRKQKRDVEQGSDTANHLKILEDSDQSSIWPTGFPSLDEPLFDDA